MDALIIPHQPACVSHGDISTRCTLQKAMKLPVLKLGLSREPCVALLLDMCQTKK